MALQLGTAVRTSMADALVTAAAGGTIKTFSGAVPVNCAAADPAGELSSGTLPSPALSSASGAATKAGTWTLTRSAAGTSASFRAYTAGAVCFAQGDVTTTGGGGVMEISSTTTAIGQVDTVTAVMLTVGGA